MELSETWFMEGYVDFELQKYRLLSYLKEVQNHFNENKLYPHLSDVIFHYNNLVSFRNNKRFLQEQFPKRLDGVDMKKLEVLYEKILADDTLMQELENITEFSVQRMKNTIEAGAEIYELIESHTQIEPIGILPLYKNEGYILLAQANASSINAYSYTITLFEDKNARYKGVRMEYIDTWKKNIVNTYPQVKKDIIKTIRALPNPAVFSIETQLQLPIEETLLPIAKRMLVKQIGKYAA